MNKFKLWFSKRFWEFVAAVWWLYEHWSEIVALVKVARRLVEAAEEYTNKSGRQKAQWFEKMLWEWHSKQEDDKDFPPPYLVNFIREFAVLKLRLAELRVKDDVSK